MTRNFNELRAKMSLAAQKRSAEMAQRYREQMVLQKKGAQSAPRFS
jgi:hypothetical protein